MLVLSILDRKGEDVVTTRPESSVHEAVSLMSSHKIGCVVVSDDGNTPIGLLSERHIIRGMAALGGKVFDKSVGDLMVSDVPQCDKQTTISKLMSMMTQKKIRHVAVMEDGVLAGVVSIGDVVKYYIEETSLEVGALRDRAGILAN